MSIHDTSDWNQSFRQVVESASNGFVITSTQGKIVLVNVQTEKLFGYTRKELLGQALDKLIPEIEQAHQSVPPASLIVTSAKRELIGLHKNGQNFPVEISLTPIETDAGLNILTSIIDITERKKLEQCKDDFLRTVSHELRTPLAILRMGIDNLEAGRIFQLTEDELSLMELLRRNTERLEKLINDLLDLSRLETHRTKTNLQSVSVQLLLDKLLRELQLVAGSKGLCIETVAPAELPLVKVDAALITRVIHNLFSNAFRFAKASIVFHIQQEGDFLHFMVVDDGDGINPEHLGSLFNKFVQINRPVGGEGYKGTGLGLAICREIIALHEGRIWAESFVGQGSQFHFIIPLDPESESHASATSNLLTCN